MIGAYFVSAQQTGRISGKITDMEMDGEPLLFANVNLKNTLFSDQTNFHGNFEFTDVAPGTYIMVVSFLGYETMEFPLVVKAGNTTSVNQSLAALSEDSSRLQLSDAHTTVLAEQGSVGKASKAKR
ncbi:hypothetical protein FGF1_17380 [Flavobacteriaceae bacterium GF1]